jgi:hypothetical protein
MKEPPRQEEEAGAVPQAGPHLAGSAIPPDAPPAVSGAAIAGAPMLILMRSDRFASRGEVRGGLTVLLKAPELAGRGGAHDDQDADHGQQQQSGQDGVLRVLRIPSAAVLGHGDSVLSARPGHAPRNR